MKVAAAPERPILAVDVGGTKLAAALVTPQGKLAAWMQESTSQAGPEASIRQIAHLLRQLTASQGISMKEISAVGIGVPAVLEPGTDRVLWAPNLSGWREVPLCPALQDDMGLPVFAEYDGHTAVLGECWQGAGRGFTNVVNVIVGTGIGCGMLLDGRLVRGANRLAGAAGWFVLTPNATLQDERSRAIGFWEANAAGPGLALRAQAQLADHPGSILQAQDIALKAEDIFSAAKQGDEYALKLLADLADWLGLGLANIVSLVNPQLVILGGGMGSRCQTLLPHIQQVILRWAQPVSAQNVQLKVSTLGFQAGLLGAAYAAMLRLSPDGEYGE